MYFDSKKGMDNLYIRLYHFRNFIKLSMIYPALTSEELDYHLSVLDELICKLDEHNRKVFNKEFVSECLEIEDILEPLNLSDDIPF